MRVYETINNLLSKNKKRNIVVELSEINKKQTHLISFIIIKELQFYNNMDQWEACLFSEDYCRSTYSPCEERQYLQNNYANHYPNITAYFEASEMTATQQNPQDYPLEFEPVQFLRALKKSQDESSLNFEDHPLSTTADSKQGTTASNQQIENEDLKQNQVSASLTSKQTKQKKSSSGITFNTVDYILKHCFKKMLSTQYRHDIQPLCQANAIHYSAFIHHWNKKLEKYPLTKHIGITKFKKMIEDIQSATVIVCRLFFNIYLTRNYPQHVASGVYEMRNQIGVHLQSVRSTIGQYIPSSKMMSQHPNHHILSINTPHMQTLKKYYRIIALPLFEDNYSYIIQGTSANRLVLVDPANPPVVLSYLQYNFPHHLVSHVLYTHKHWDHAGQSLSLYNQLKIRNPKVEVVIGEHDRNFVEGATYSLKVDENIEVGNSKVKTLHVPCHTKGHTIYSFLPLQQQPSEHTPIVQKETVEGKRVRVFESQSCTFTGDTLFIGGIGRFFEGNATQMVENIRKMYDKIDLNSDIYCRHEYTLPNLRWSSQVENQNGEIRQYLSRIQQQQDLCTIPSSLARQKQINIFVRSVTGSPLLSRVQNSSQLLMKTLRQMKNSNSVDFPSEKSSL